MGRNLPQKNAFPWVHERPSNRWFFEPTRVHIPKRHLDQLVPVCKAHAAYSPYKSGDVPPTNCPLFWGIRTPRLWCWRGSRCLGAGVRVRGQMSGHVRRRRSSDSTNYVPRATDGAENGEKRTESGAGRRLDGRHQRAGSSEPQNE